MATSFTSAGVVFDATNAPAQVAGSGNSNSFDDYEEGTFTATFSECTLSGGNRQGRYVKIGEFVMVWFDVTGTISNVTAGPQVTGLPFTAIVSTAGAGYGAPVFRAATAMNSDFRVYGSSSYHTSDAKINLTSYNSAGVEGTAGWQTGNLRLTGWTCYFTAT